MVVWRLTLKVINNVIMCSHQTGLEDDDSILGRNRDPNKTGDDGKLA